MQIELCPPPPYEINTPWVMSLFLNSAMKKKVIQSKAVIFKILNKRMV